MRRWIGVGIVAAFVVSVPAAALAASARPPAATGTMSSVVDRQAGVWRLGSVSTTSTSWRPVAGLQTRICAAGQVSATVSLEGTGAPMGVLVRVDGGPTMRPDAIRFAPVGAADTASFTFLQSVSAFEANDHHVFEMEWRSPFEKKTTLIEATMTLVYHEGTHACP